jgi:hypothetical protein
MGIGLGSSRTPDAGTPTASTCCSRPISPSQSACLHHLRPLLHHSHLLADCCHTGSCSEAAADSTAVAIESVAAFA